MKTILRNIYLIAFLASPIVNAAPAVFEDFSSSMSEQKFDGTEQTMEINSSGELVLSSRAKSYLPSIPRSNQLFLNDSGGIRTFSADLKVTEVSLGNAETQQAVIRMAGTFYLTDTGRAWAGINIGDRGNGLEAWYEISVDSYDINGQYISSVFAAVGSLAIEGLSLNTTYPVSITYDGDDGLTFIFNNGTPVIVSGPAKTGESPYWKGVGTRLRFGQNNSTPEIYGDEKPDDGTTASILGAVDNVTTDITDLGDDFSSANLDMWTNDPTSKTINAEGKLVMTASSTGSRNGGRVNVRSRINQHGLKYVGAKVTLSSSSTPSANTWIRARIYNYLGNDTYDVSNGDAANGWEGNIFAQFTIDRFENDTFRLLAYIERADDADYTSGTEVTRRDLSPPGKPPGYDVQYSLVIELVDTMVNFVVDGETLYNYDLAIPTDRLSGNVYSVTNTAQAQLNARVQQGAGRVVAVFDDVTTDLMPPTVSLNATNSDDEQVALPEEVIVNVGEIVKLIADASNPTDIIKYVWEQIGGTDIELPEVAGRATNTNALAKVIGTENQVSFIVPDGSDTEDLAFTVTTVDKSGLESEDTFTLAVDNSKTSTLSPDTNPEPTSSGGSFNFFFIFMLLLTFTAKLKLRSRV